MGCDNVSTDDTTANDEKSDDDVITSDHKHNPGKRRRRKCNSKSVDSSNQHHDRRKTWREKSAENRGSKTSTEKFELAEFEITEDLLCRTRQKAKKFAARKQGDAAIYEFIKCLALTKIVYGEEHWRLAYAHVLLAEAYLDLKEYGSQALEHSEYARTIMLIIPYRPRSARKKADLLKVMILIYLTTGKAQLKLRKHRIAHHNLQQAASLANDYSMSSKIPKRNAKALSCKVLLAMARLQVARKKYDDSLHLYKQLLNLTEDVYGMNSTQTIPIHQSLGTVYQQLQSPNHDKALDHFKSAIEIGTCRYEADSKEIMNAELLLAKAYLATNAGMSNSMAETHLRNILMCLEDKHGSRELLFLKSEDLLVSLLIISSREEEAIELLTSSLLRKRRVFGSCSNVVIMALKLLGSLHLSLAEIPPAIKYLKKCLDIELIVFGSNHPNVRSTQQTLSIIHKNPSLSTK